MNITIFVKFANIFCKLYTIFGQIINHFMENPRKGTVNRVEVKH